MTSYYVTTLMAYVVYPLWVSLLLVVLFAFVVGLLDGRKLKFNHCYYTHTTTEYNNNFIVCFFLLFELN